MDEKIFNEICFELGKAKAKHPEFPSDPEGGFAIIAEEALELIRAINDKESKARIKEEACHVIVTAYRLIEALEAENGTKHWTINEKGDVNDENN